jgi:hypothetical protein
VYVREREISARRTIAVKQPRNVYINADEWKRIRRMHEDRFLSGEKGLLTCKRFPAKTLKR